MTETAPAADIHAGDFIRVLPGGSPQQVEARRTLDDGGIMFRFGADEKAFPADTEFEVTHRWPHAPAGWINAHTKQRKARR